VVLSLLYDGLSRSHWLSYEADVDVEISPPTENTLTVKILSSPYIPPTQKRENLQQATATPSNSTDNCRDANLTQQVLYQMQYAAETIFKIQWEDDLKKRLNFTSTGDGDCTVVATLDSSTPPPIGAIVGGAVGGSIVLLALLMLAYKVWREKDQKWLKSLPPLVRRYVDLDRVHREHDWAKIDGNYFKLLKPGSKDWKEWEQFIETLQGSKIPFAEVYAVLNPLLISNFANWRLIMNNRMISNPNLFDRKDWLVKADRVDLRKFVYAAYKDKTAQVPWNDENENVPIIPVLHGCDFQVAKSIAAKGFAALASLDEGFYGKGIYFTSYAMYTIPYSIAKEEPAVIVALACLGNVYPVVEHHKRPGNFMGKAHVAGYQTHYVLTQKTGEVLEDKDSDVIYDEIVISQEAQVVPIFIGKINQDAKKKLRRY